MYKLFTFHSTHFALFMERVLMDNNINVKLIPVPRDISSSCGIAGRIANEDYENAVKILGDNEIEISSAYEMNQEGKVVGKIS